MSPTPLPDEYTLRAARRGSRPAREAVLAGYLPLIYNLVARALPDPAWVDDAVVEVLGALVTDLDEPRDAAARQSWVVAAALRQVRLARRRTRPRRSAARDVADAVPARLRDSAIGRTLPGAARWLNPDDQELFALWWLLTSGHLTDADVAGARVPAPDEAAFRTMRARLAEARAVQLALAAESDCARLALLTSGWDGQPAPALRERLGAHTRACSRCGPASAVLAEPERQLAGLPLIPPPPYLVDVVPDVVGTHPRHGTPFEAPPLGQRHPLLGKPVVAALAVLLLVACVELAVVFATRADGQPSTVVLEAPQPAVVNSPASPYQTLFAPQPPLTNASPPPFSRLVPAVPTLVSALDFGPIDQHSRVLGRDNGQSVKYGDRSVWIFDDTQLHDPIGFLNNSGAVTTDLNAADGITVTSSNPFDLNTGKGPTELVTLSPAEAAFERIHGAPGHCAGSSDRYCGIRFAMWPGPVVADPARHRLLVFYHKLCRFGVGGMPCSGAYGQSIGSGVAALDMSTGAITRLTAELPRPIASPEGADPSMFFPPQDEFYSGALAIGDTAYVYGNCKVTCQLARVPMGQITDRAQWQFYAGRDATGAALWSSRPAAAVGTLVKGVAGNSVLYAPALHGFLNIYMPWATNTVMFQIGGSPYGPWSTPYPLTQTPAPAEKPNYAAFAHVEYAEQNGLVQYVTYYQPSSGKVNLLRITFQPG